MASALTATLRADITQFERAISQAETKITGLQRSTTQVNRELAKFGNDFGGATLIRQANSMAKAVEDIGGVTKLTTAEQKRLAGTVDEALAKYRALGQEVPAALVKVSSALGEVRKAEEEAIRGAEALRVAQKKAADAQAVALKQSGDGFSALNKITGAFGVTLGASFAVGTVVNFAKDVVALGSKISDLSARMGVGVEAAQEINYALEQTGSSAEAGAKAISKMGDSLTEGKAGTVAALKSLNLEINTLRGLKPEDAFTAIAAEIQKVPDPMRQTQLAMELFGKAGVEILPAIKQGMGDLRDEAKRLGVVLSEEDVKALDDFGDKWDQTMSRLQVSAAKTALIIADAFKQSWSQILKDQIAALSGLTSGDLAASIASGIAASASRSRQQPSGPVDYGASDALMDGASNGQSGSGPSRAIGKTVAEMEAAAKAAEKWADAVRSAIDRATGADAQRQIKVLSAAYAGLSADQKQNGEIVRRLLEPYEALRKQVHALPPEIEKARAQFAPLPSRNLFTSTVTGMMQIVQAAPAMLNTTQQTQNLLKGLRADGLLPTTNAWVGYANAVDASAVKSRPVQTALVEGKMKTIEWADSINGLSRAFADLAQIGGDSFGGIIKQIGEVIGLMGVGAQVGKNFRDSFFNPNGGAVDPKTGKPMGRFDFSALGGGQGTGAAIGAYTNLATTAVAAYGALDQATNVKGRGNRAARGALTGAAIGNSIVPGYGALVGAAVGALVGAFRNPAFEDVYNRVAKNFGVKLSDETAKGIANLAKSDFKGDRGAAEIFSLDTIIGEGGGLKAGNIEQLTARLRDAFSLKEVGKFNADQLTDVLNKNFGAFADFASKSTTIAGKGFAEIARLAKAAGVEIEGIKKFVGEQTGKVGGGLADLAGPLLEAAGLSQQVKAAEAAQKAAAEKVAASREGKSDADLGVGDRDAIAKAEQEQKAAADALAEITKKMGAGTKDAQAEFDRLGIIAVGAFNAARQSGLGYLEAVDQLSPGLDRMIAIQGELGLAGNAAFDELSKFRDLVSGNETLVASAEALNGTILALSNIGGLTTETLAAMEGQGLQTFERLTAAGFTTNQALEIQAEFIKNVELAHKQLGIPIDGNTQKLIDQAKQLGLLEEKDPTKLMKQGFDSVVKAVKDLTNALLGVGPAAEAAGKDIRDGIPTSVPVEIDYRFPEGRAPWDEQYERGGGTGSPPNPPGLATGGIVRARAGGTIVRVGEGGRDEAVIPLPAGGSGGISVPALVSALKQIQFIGTLENGGRPLLRYVSRELGEFIETRTGQRVPI